MFPIPNEVVATDGRRWWPDHTHYENDILVAQTLWINESPGNASPYQIEVRQPMDGDTPLYWLTCAVCGKQLLSDGEFDCEKVVGGLAFGSLSAALAASFTHGWVGLGGGSTYCARCFTTGAFLPNTEGDDWQVECLTVAGSV